MKCLTLIISIAAVMFQFVSCAQEKAAVYFRYVEAVNDSVRVIGRVKSDSNTVFIFWPGTSIQMKFKGTSARVKMDDEQGNNFFNVIVDGEYQRYIDLDIGINEYIVAEGLSDDEHTIQLIKRTEWDKGKTRFIEFVIAGKLLPLPKSNKRIIEVFGNSITAGYAIEDTTGRDSPEGLNTNNYNTYASLTARHFQADLYLTVKSGIGVTVSWFPLIMPEMYNRLDPQDSSSRWNFKVQPQVVIVNLLQNDSWLVNKPNHPSFGQRFGKHPPKPEGIIKAYTEFLQNLRVAYPNAYIICSLGCMDAVRPGAPWSKYVTQSVARLNDSKILTHFFPYIERNGHPTKEHNVEMAKSLISFIEQHVAW